MDTAMLYALRDPAGIPSHPVIFLVLGVLTFALHIAAVQMMLGASGLTLWGALSSDPNRRRLAQAMLGVAKVMTSVAVLLGVAPLLFVQVLFDPMWYASNVLSAWWVIGFIFILIAGYLLMYVFHSLNPGLAARKKSTCPGSMLLSIALMLVVGYIMHALTYQMLFPDQWVEWYAPGGNLDTSGTTLHTFNLWRFGFFIALSIPVAGALLVGYQRYYAARADYDRGYLAWTGRLGQGLIAVGGVIAVTFGALWMATLPENQAAFVTSPWVFVALAALLGFVAFARWVNGRMESGWAYSVLGVGAVALIVVAAAREALRWSVLFGVFGYDALDYQVNMDWYSTITFFVTFGVLGGGVLGYLLTVAWQAGRTQGVYTPGPFVTRMGSMALWMIVLWIVHYFAVGLYVWFR